MPPKTPKKNGGKSAKIQPKIQDYARKLRSKHNSAPGSYMPDIEEEDELFEPLEEPLSDEANLKEVITKLNEIGRRVESIEFALFNEDVGLKRRTASLELKTETAHGKQLFINKEYKTVKQDLAVVKGTLQRQSVQINAMDNKIVDLTARSMAKNMIISGIVENEGENCKFAVKTFLKEEMDIDLDMCPEMEIKIAHRMGIPREKAKKKSARAMIAKVNQALKEVMMENLDRLKERFNIQGDPFYVNIQQPEARLESRRNAKAILKRYQNKFPQAKVEIRGEKVYLNNEWKRPLVHAPQPHDLYHDPEEQKELNKIKVAYTQPDTAKSSTFWAAAVRAYSTTEVQRAYNKIRQEAPAIDHIPMAFATKHEEESTSGLVDDKEHGAGHKILRAIREAKEQNIAIFVARRFGGEHIGPARFDIISKLATKAIAQLNSLLPSTPRPQQVSPGNAPEEQ